MTYKLLAEKISRMDEKQQNCDATVFDIFENEYFPVKDLLFAGEENDVFDENHPYLSF